MNKNLKIGIVVADNDEYKPLADYILKGKYEEYTFLGRQGHSFKLESQKGNADVISILCGIGKVNATAVATHLVDIGCNVILNFGLSGGISGVNRGDICVCDTFLEHDFDLTGIGYKPCEKPSQKYIYESDKQLRELFSSVIPNLKYGTAVSGDHFVCDPERRNFLKTTFNATSCDMETAAVAYVCNFAGVPFAAIRKISDDAGADAVDNYRDMNTSNDTDLVNIVIKCMKAVIDNL